MTEWKLYLATALAATYTAAWLAIAEAPERAPAPPPPPADVTIVPPPGWQIATPGERLVRHRPPARPPRRVRTRSS